MRFKGFEVALAIFALFFGVSLLDAISSGNWIGVGFWLLIATLFLILGSSHDKRHI